MEEMLKALEGTMDSLRTRLQKHGSGTHDEGSHGNWASGGSSGGGSSSGGSSNGGSKGGGSKSGSSKPRQDGFDDNDFYDAIENESLSKYDFGYVDGFVDEKIMPNPKRKAAWKKGMQEYERISAKTGKSKVTWGQGEFPTKYGFKTDQESEDYYFGMQYGEASANSFNS